MLDKLKEIKASMEKEIAEASTAQQIQDLKVKYLGKKGSLSEINKSMKNLSNDLKPKVGKMVTEVRKSFETSMNDKLTELNRIALERQLENETIDVTLPGKAVDLGSKHPVTMVIDDIKEIFLGMGYSIAEGPQVELDYYNFERLNLAKDHPARDMQDSFYINPNVLLRTHTSPVQARTMDKVFPQLPVKIICPGVVYRRDDDATHSPMFHQVEGLVVGQNISMAHLRGTLTAFVRSVFGGHTEVRFRPSFFPFTEPSAEVDISCCMCGGKGHINGEPCRVCKTTGWVEILGCGMVDPAVFASVGYPADVSGFAFGLGVERVAMLKYGIGDLRMFFENDVRFLGQFGLHA